MEEYLIVSELSKRIKMTPGTIRNLIWKGELVKQVHFVKPTPKKILFIWSAVEAWLHRDSLHYKSNNSDDSLRITI